MLWKALFCIVGFTSIWTGLVLMFKGFAVPGVIVLGIGYVMFSVLYPTEVGE